MNLPGFRFTLVALFTLLAASAAVAKSPILSTRCTEDSGRNYSLYVTVPSGGYELSVAHTTTRKGVLKIAVKYTPPSGFTTQALVMHRLRFTFTDILRPGRYVVVANGEKLDRAQLIDSRNRIRIQ